MEVKLRAAAVREHRPSLDLRLKTAANIPNLWIDHSVFSLLQDPVLKNPVEIEISLGQT